MTCQRPLQDLEQALVIDDKKHYFKEKEIQEILYRISQISFSGRRRPRILA